MKKAIIASLLVTALVCVFLTGCNNAEDGKITEENKSTTSDTAQSSTIENNDANDIVSDASDAADQVGDNIGDAASDLANGVGEAASDAADGVGKGVQDLVR